MDRVIFGDNQFFGINHLSESKARQQSRKFKNISNITNTLDFVNDIGIKSFMVTSYPELDKICNYIGKNEKYKGFKVSPCLPYAHKYANEVTDLGIFGTVNKYLKGNIIKSISKGSMAIIKQDFYKIMEILVDSELSMFCNGSTNAIFTKVHVLFLLASYFYNLLRNKVYILS